MRNFNSWNFEFYIIKLCKIWYSSLYFTPKWSWWSMVYLSVYLCSPFNIASFLGENFWNKRSLKNEYPSHTSHYSKETKFSFTRAKLSDVHSSLKRLHLAWNLNAKQPSYTDFKESCFACTENLSNAFVCACSLYFWIEISNHVNLLVTNKWENFK